jgi:hypothetical protein
MYLLYIAQPIRFWHGSLLASWPPWWRDTESSAYGLGRILWVWHFGCFFWLKQCHRTIFFSNHYVQTLIRLKHLTWHRRSTHGDEAAIAAKKSSLTFHSTKMCPQFHSLQNWHASSKPYSIKSEHRIRYFFMEQIPEAFHYVQTNVHLSSERATETISISRRHCFSCLAVWFLRNWRWRRRRCN